MSADDLTHDAVVSPTDLAALSADDELLRVAARVDPRTALSDDPLLRVLLAWRRAVDAAPFPPLIGVDTALRLVRRREAAPDPRVRSIVGAVLIPAVVLCIIVAVLWIS
ncbi:MAG: hypothetical protein ACRD0V_18740 [Acidimicrobiales bacterium]